MLVSGIMLYVLSQYISIDLAHLRLPNPLLYYPIAILGLVLLLSMNRLLQGKWLQKAVVYVGKHSLPILALHFLCFKLVTFLLIINSMQNLSLSDFPMPSLSDKVFLPLLYSAAGVILPLGANVAFEYLKAKILNK